jgi:hypothetical protein
MPSAFETEVAAELVPELLDEFGTSSWTYTPPSGAATSSLTVIVDESESGVEVDGVDLDTERAALLKVSQAALAAPVRNGKLSDGTDTWVITRAPVLRGGMWHCVCAYRERAEIGARRG